MTRRFNENADGKAEGVASVGRIVDDGIHRGVLSVARGMGYDGWKLWLNRDRFVVLAFHEKAGRFQVI